MHASIKRDRDLWYGHAAPGCMEECWTAPPSVVPRPRFLGHTMDIWRVTSCLLTHSLTRDRNERQRRWYHGGRILISALHFNENCNRKMVSHLASTRSQFWKPEVAHHYKWSDTPWLRLRLQDSTYGALQIRVLNFFYTLCNMPDVIVTGNIWDSFTQIFLDTRTCRSWYLLYQRV